MGALVPSDLERAQRLTPAQKAALDALAAERRKPDDADRPPLSTVPRREGEAAAGSAHARDDAACAVCAVCGSGPCVGGGTTGEGACPKWRPVAAKRGAFGPLW